MEPELGEGGWDERGDYWTTVKQSVIPRAMSSKTKNRLWWKDIGQESTRTDLILSGVLLGGLALDVSGQLVGGAFGC